MSFRRNWTVSRHSQEGKRKLSHANEDASQNLGTWCLFGRFLRPTAALSLGGYGAIVPGLLLASLVGSQVLLRLFPLLGRNDAVALGSAGVSPAVFGVPPKTIVATRRRTVR